MREGFLRVSRGKDGSLELWARGWRLESRMLPALPLVLAIGFLYSPAPLVVRAAGAVALSGLAFVAQRLTRVGLRITGNAITVVNLTKAHWVPWREFVGFVGERSSRDGRCVLIRTSGDPIPLSGTLDAEALNPYGEEGDLSAIDDLNRMVTRFRRELANGDVVDLSKEDVTDVTRRPAVRRISAAG